MLASFLIKEQIPFLCLCVSYQGNGEGKVLENSQGNSGEVIVSLLWKQFS